MATITNNTASFTSKSEVLTALAAGSITVDAASAWLKQHETNGNGKDHGFYVKANPAKGTVSLYGINRMPVTLFPEQWRTLLGENCDGPAGKIVLAFLDKYADYLPKRKGDQPAKKVPAELIGEGKPFRIPVARDE